MARFNGTMSAAMMLAACGFGVPLVPTIKPSSAWAAGIGRVANVAAGAPSTATTASLNPVPADPSFTQIGNGFPCQAIGNLDFADGLFVSNGGKFRIGCIATSGDPIYSQPLDRFVFTIGGSTVTVPSTLMARSASTFVRDGATKTEVHWGAFVDLLPYDTVSCGQIQVTCDIYPKRGFPRRVQKMLWFNPLGLAIHAGQTWYVDSGNPNASDTNTTAGWGTSWDKPLATINVGAVSAAVKAGATAPLIMVRKATLETGFGPTYTYYEGTGKWPVRVVGDPAQAREANEISRKYGRAYWPEGSSNLQQGSWTPNFGQNAATTFENIFLNTVNIPCARGNFILLNSLRGVDKHDGMGLCMNGVQTDALYGFQNPLGYGLQKQGFGNAVSGAFANNEVWKLDFAASTGNFQIMNSDWVDYFALPCTFSKNSRFACASDISRPGAGYFTLNASFHLDDNVNMFERYSAEECLLTSADAVWVTTDNTAYVMTDAATGGTATLRNAAGITRIPLANNPNTNYPPTLRPGGLQAIVLDQASPLYGFSDFGGDGGLSVLGVDRGSTSTTAFLYVAGDATSLKAGSHLMYGIGGTAGDHGDWMQEGQASDGGAATGPSATSVPSNVIIAHVRMSGRSAEGYFQDGTQGNFANSGLVTNGSGGWYQTLSALALGSTTIAGYTDGDLVTGPTGAGITPFTAKLSVDSGTGYVTAAQIQVKGFYPTGPGGAQSVTGGTGSGLTLIPTWTNLLGTYSIQVAADGTFSTLWNGIVKPLPWLQPGHMINFTDTGTMTARYANIVRYAYKATPTAPDLSSADPSLNGTYAPGRGVFDYPLVDSTGAAGVAYPTQDGAGAFTVTNTMKDWWWCNIMADRGGGFGTDVYSLGGGKKHWVIDNHYAPRATLVAPYYSSRKAGFGPMRDIYVSASIFGGYDYGAPVGSTNVTITDAFHFSESVQALYGTFPSGFDASNEGLGLAKAQFPTPDQWSTVAAVLPAVNDDIPLVASSIINKRRTKVPRYPVDIDGRPITIGSLIGARVA